MEQRRRYEHAQGGVDLARLKEGHGGIEREQDVTHGGSATPAHPGLAHGPVDGGLGKEVWLVSGRNHIGFLGVPPVTPRHQVRVFCVRVGRFVEEGGDGDVQLPEHVLGEVAEGHADQLGELVVVLVGEEGQLVVGLEEV